MAGYPGRMQRTIWISAGEASGDLHGALLVEGLRALAPGWRFRGMGGPAMTDRGFIPEFASSAVSLVGATEVLAHLPRIAGILARTWFRLKALRPAAVVLIDAPDFNFLVARMAHRLGIPVYYYISPQVWAWRTGRVHTLRRLARKILCILPFEVDFYARHGVSAEFVGHPLLDSIPQGAMAALEPERWRVGILPGSRRREIESLGPVFAQTAQRLYADFPQLTVTVVRAPGVKTAFLRDHVAAHLPEGIPLDIAGPEDRYWDMRRCRLLLAASGTVTLEAALVGVPTVVAYKLSELSAAIARRVIKVPFASLPNLIIGREVFPEALQERATPEHIASLARLWLAEDAQSRSAYAAVLKDLDQLRALMGPPGAAMRAAGSIVTDLKAQGANIVA